jgi:VWFA-related protein
MRQFKIFFLLLILSASFAPAVFAQDKNAEDDDEVLRVETQLVDVPVEITDRSGKPILNLKQSNFVVYEDGKRQELADFAATSAPFEVALLLDTSGSARSELPLITRAAENFINSLRPGDRVSIISFRSDREGGKAISFSEVLTELTDDRIKLKNVIKTINVSNGTPILRRTAASSRAGFRRAARREISRQAGARRFDRRR